MKEVQPNIASMLRCMEIQMLRVDWLAVIDEGSDGIRIGDRGLGLGSNANNWEFQENKGYLEQVHRDALEWSLEEVF